MDTISFDEFRRLVAKQLHLDEASVTSEASFVDDLLADSIQLVEMMLHLEEQGIAIPLDAAWDVRTVGQAYDLYRQQAQGDQPSAFSDQPSAVSG